ncbi:MAG: tyrosine-type recombinase/integrase [Methanomassiliicoccaceae archaeon]|nr:tyrosine-type recombinase/integrase [Methanomassiliicoccaceae archaeon]
MKRSDRWSDERTSIRLGRYPFAAGIKYYSEKKTIRFSETTIYNNTRKLNYFSDMLEQLKAAEKIRTTDPRHIGAREIEAFFRWMKLRKLNACSQGTYTKILKGYLEFWGNDIIEQMADDDEIVIKTSSGEGEVHAMSIDEVRRIFAAADELEGYKGIVMRLLLPIAFGTGCRPKELFDAELEDIDVGAETFYVRHPKGEGSWGKKEKVNIIRKDMIIRIEEGLQERAEYLKGLGIRSEYVFVSPDTGEPLVGNTFRKYKRAVERISGVSFMIKDLRPTLLSLLVDDDLSLLGAASKQLRHARIANTEKYYLKIDKRKAVRNALGDRWKKDAVGPSENEKNQ